MEGEDGSYWIGVEGGLSQYRPCAVPPTVRVRGAITNRRREVAQEVQVSAGERVVIDGGDGLEDGARVKEIE